MSFIAGFADSFNEGIKRNQAIAASEKQSLMNISFKSFLDNEGKMAERKAQEAQQVKKTRALMARHGIDPGAFNNVFEIVSSGMADKDIGEMLAGGSFAPAKKSNAKSQTEEMFSTQSVDSRQQAQEAPQMGQGASQGASQADPSAIPQDSAPQAPASSKEASQVKKNQGRAGLLGALSGVVFPQNNLGDVRSESVQKLAQATGKTEEEIQQTMSGIMPESQYSDTSGFAYTPNQTAPDMFGGLDATTESKAMEALARTRYMQSVNPTPQGEAQIQYLEDVLKQHASAKQAQTDATNKFGLRTNVWDKDGNYLGAMTDMEVQNLPSQGVEIGNMQPQLESEVSRMDAITDQIDKDYKPVREKMLSAQTAMEIFNQMDDTVDQDAAVLHTVAPAAAEAVRSIVDEVSSTANLIQQSFQKEDLSGVSSAQLNSNLKRAQGLANDPRLSASDKLAARKALFEAQKNIFAYHLGMSLGQEGRGLAEAERALFTDIAGTGRNINTFRENMANVLGPIINDIDRQGKDVIENNGAIKSFNKRYGYYPSVEGIAFKEMLSESQNPSIQKAYGIISGNSPREDEVVQSSGIPSGIDPVDWEFMTEEERKLFQ